MAHLAFDEARKTEKGTPDRWLPVAAQVADYARRFSGRGDIVANVGPGVGGPYGTACWNPILCDMDVNSDTCLPGIGPDRVDMKDEVFVLGALPFVGAVTHEAAHARWSAWVPQTLIDRAKEGYESWDKAHMDVVIALEESRIEYRALRRRPDVREALTQMALSIVLRDFKVADTPYGASIGAALTLARQDAGLFSDTEAAIFQAKIAEILPPETLEILRSLWRRFHALPRRVEENDHFAAMWQIAEEWLQAVREATPEGEDGEPGQSGIPGEGKGGEGEKGEGGEGGCAFDFDGEGGEESSGGEGEGEDGGLAKAIREAAGEAAMDREGEALDKRAEKVAERHVAEKAADHERQAAGKKMIARRHGGGLAGFSRYAGSRKRGSRDPEPAERAAANRLGGMLEKVTWRDRAIAKVDRVVPGGRLRPRAAVQKAADAARGGRAPIPMWRAKERKRTDETPITVGILTDVSGSMSGAEDASAVLTYVLSNAVHGIDGKVATAVFGEKGYLVHRAHERPTKVEPWRACEGTEAFREGALLIDAELGLLDGVGARILVIFTDSYFVNGTDAAYARTFMALCKAKGVAVVWANTDGAPVDNFGYGSRVRVSGSPSDIAETLGKAVLAETKKAEAARA